jgi:indolepyruvate ferredoxin oxidoreductase alpha subunit
MRLKNDPFHMMDCKFCMGASVSVASGLAHTEKDRRVIAIIGDSAFFHTGISAYMSAAANGANIFVIVLDNEATAMTGYQSHPGSPLDIRGGEQSNVDLDKLLQVPQLQHYFSLDAFGDAHVLASAFRTCLEAEGLAVILVRGPCPFIKSRAQCT